MRRLLSATGALAACLAIVVLVGARGGGEGERRTYRIVFDNAFGLVEGGDFRIGGVRAGQTTRFEIKPSRSGPPKAVVVAEVRQGGFKGLRRGAECTIEPQSLVGEYYVDCQPGSGPKLPDGGTIPLEQTRGTIPADLVNDMLRRPARERLRLLVASLGTGLAGRPDDLQAVLRRAHPGLRETGEALAILGDQNRTIDAFIRDADTVVGAVAARRKDASRFIREAAGAAETGASRREQLGRAVNRLPRFLHELEPSMARLSELAAEGGPLATELQAAAPSATTLLRRLGPFSRAALPALRDLGEAAVPARQALREGRAETRTLRRLAIDAPGTAKPLRQVLQTLDDRRRAIDEDPRAAATSPPAPDPTHHTGRAGFTGFEALVNYFFWQAMTTNGFDAVGHLLRVGVTQTKCSPYRNAPPQSEEDEILFRDCNSWLGPRQPGINAPDPSSPSAPTARRLRAQSERPARRVGERRGPGEPDAGPVAGQPDVSKPQIVLPPPVRDLLGRLLPGGTLPRVGDSLRAPGGPADSQLLDYLLGP